MKIQKHLLFISFFLLVTGVLFSQKIKFNRVFDGQKNNFQSIFSLVQDQKGYIWFTSTSKGLQRYDGKKLTSFSHNNDNVNSLANNVALTCTADSAGNIWAGTAGSGLDRLDPVSKKFTHFRHDPKEPGSLLNDTIFALSTDHLGNIWIGSFRGVDRYDPRTGKFTHYKIKGLTDFSRGVNNYIVVNVIYEDKKGMIWVGWGDPFYGKKDGPGGLLKIDQTTGKMVSYNYDPKDPQSLADNNVFSIYEDSKNNLWVGTKGEGLHVLNRATGKFTHYPYDPAHPEKLNRPPYEGEVNNFISFIKEDAKKRLWIGSSSAGINMYDPVLEKTTHFGLVSGDKTNRYAKDTLSGFKDSLAISAITTKDGLFWISTLEGNLYNLDLFSTEVPFTSLGMAAGAFYLEEDKQVLWMSSDSGVIRRNLSTGQQKLYKHDPGNPTGLSSGIIMDMKGDGEGNIWFAMHSSGIDKYDIKTDKFTYIRHNANDPSSLAHDSVHALFFDSKHYLWVATHNGLSKMDTKTGKCINYVNDPKDSLSLRQGSLNNITEDKNGNIWICSDYMYRLDQKTGKFSHYFMGVASLVNMHVDASGELWVTGPDGLFYFNKEKNNFIKFTCPAFPGGLEEVLGIVEDLHGNLWVSNSIKIIRISRDRNAVEVFNESQGVRLTVGIWMRNIRSKDGRLFLGNSKGYYSFKPEELISERTPPLLQFVNLKLGSQDILPGSNGILREPLWRTNHFELDHTQNTFSLEFIAFDYRSTGDIKYLYKLENYDEEWRDIGSESRAMFFNLPPGKYVLHVKAINDQGSIIEKTLSITITPPWWKTWWAYSLYVLLFILLGFVIYKYQRNFIVKREKERTQQKELAQAKEIEKAYNELRNTQAQLVQSEKMASLGELTAGIAHEIQNPLNFVNNFSEVNAELIAEMNEELSKGNLEEAKQIAKNIDENEQKIIFHGKRADAIVKGMLQHSRSNSGQKEPTDINALCDEYLRLSYHGLRAKDKSFNASMVTDFDPSIGSIPVIAQDLGRVILNLINNAFYAVDDKKRSILKDNYNPTVTVSTKKVNDKVEIRVADNGKGIPQKVLDKIFQPFFTTKPTGVGTGLGLSLSYDIVKAHGGEIKVETNEGEGTTFIIQLPNN